METLEIVIIGAGVIGCAVAEKLAKQGYSPIVLEAGPRIAEGITSRNSGVIHAGLYYPPDSLKSKLCIRGNHLLYEWCYKNNVPYKKTGKWIVGLKNESNDLEEMYQNAMASGASGLVRKTQSEINIEGVRAECAVFSENTGIVDPYELCHSLMISAQENEASFIFNTRVLSISKQLDNWEIQTSNGPIDAEVVINCAGLDCDSIAKMADINEYKIYPCRGLYFRVKNYAHRLDTLVYPVKKKNSPGLGIHLTVGLDGSLKLGPDTEYINNKHEYSVSEGLLKEKKLQFYESARRFLPDLKLDSIEYDTCGIRPKTRSPVDLTEKDFVISNDKPGFINLIGIESPGLTSSLAIAETVATLLK